MSKLSVVPIALFLLGLVLGVLAGLSTAAGTAAAIIALLGTLVGGSLLTWFNPNNLSDEQRTPVALGVCSLSVGCLVGLGAGFFLRATDPVGTLSGGKKVSEAVSAREIASAVAATSCAKLLEEIYTRALHALTDDKTHAEDSQKRVVALLQDAAMLGPVESTSAAGDQSKNGKDGGFTPPLPITPPLGTFVGERSPVYWTPYQFGRMQEAKNEFQPGDILNLFANKGKVLRDEASSQGRSPDAKIKEKLRAAGNKIDESIKKLTPKKPPTQSELDKLQEHVRELSEGEF